MENIDLVKNLGFASAFYSVYISHIDRLLGLLYYIPMVFAFPLFQACIHTLAASFEASLCFDWYTELFIKAHVKNVDNGSLT